MSTIGLCPEVYRINMRYITSHRIQVPYLCYPPIYSNYFKITPLFGFLEKKFSYAFLMSPIRVRKHSPPTKSSVFLSSYVSRQTQLYRPDILVLYSVLLHVSTVYINHNHVGISRNM